MIRSLATMIGLIAAALLPAPMRGWGMAMRCEIDAAESDGAALRFALGCLTCALGEATHAAIIDPLRLPFVTDPTNGDTPMPFASRLSGSPRNIAALCAVGATGLGLIYMAIGGAPTRYLILNSTALLLGFAIAAAAVAGARALGSRADMIAPTMGIGLLLASLFGTGIDGATRWIAVGTLFIQPSLILLPALTMAFALRRDARSTLGVVAAALAMAIQPDRAMAGALAAGTLMVAIASPGRHSLIALAAATVGLTVTLARPDVQPAMPFVDQILSSSFAVHPIAGLSVVAGALLMILPAIVGALRDQRRREIHLVFGAIWLAIIAAAALGNYPTPLVGYGGSAIIGYLLSLIGLPHHSPDTVSAAHSGRRAQNPETGRGERGGHARHVPC